MKDYLGKPAIISLKTLGGHDDKVAVSDSESGEIVYNEKTKQFSIHFCACRCYSK
jgi:hypothetical protein